MSAAHHLLPITRESVAAGDDVSAPHTATLSVPVNASSLDVCKAVKSSRYLARISGGRATWLILLDDIPAGIVAQQRDDPMVIATSVKPGQNSRVHCKYLAQQDPDAAYAYFAAQVSGNNS